MTMVQHAHPDAQAADVAARLADAGVKYAAISFDGMHGKPEAKMVPLSHLGQATKGSEMFTGAALDGVPQDVDDDEVAPRPDLAAGNIMPFNSEVAWFPGDPWVVDVPFEACSRQILKRVTADAASLGYTFNLGIETDSSCSPTIASALRRQAVPMTIWTSRVTTFGDCYTTVRWWTKSSPR